MDRRSHFLAEFLGALGALEIRHLQVMPESVSGTAVYDSNEPGEQQEFRWSVPSSAAPSAAATRLVSLIRAEKLLRGDKLQISRQDLMERFNVDQHLGFSSEQFTTVLEELLQIKVPMLDDGVESDYYFIHE